MKIPIVNPGGLLENYKTMSVLTGGGRNPARFKLKTITKKKFI